VWIRRRSAPEPILRRQATDVALDEFVQTVTPAPSPLAFRRVVVSEVRRIVKARSVFYLTFRHTEEAYCLEEHSGDSEPPPSLKCPRNGTLVKWLRANEQPLVPAYQPGVIAYLCETERNLLDACHISMCLPLIAGRQLVAIVMVVAQEEPWRPPRDVEMLLTRCASHAAVLSEVVVHRQAQRERLEAASRAQQLAIAGQLAAAVAHEVRNPLATIRSSVQYVADSPAGWSQKSAVLQQVVGEVDRINRTLSAMLGLSRPQALEVSDVDLGALVQDALILVQPYVDHQHLTLERTGCDEPLSVRADRRQVHQVLLNVLINACQATERGGRLTIGIDTHAEMARVRVSDTGVGIAAEDRQRAFDPFFTTKSSGSGLGLAICRQIMTKHGGTIDLESELGVGTTVTLLLPRVAP
jgi:signal transduction histidine kinase